MNDIIHFRPGGRLAVPLPFPLMETVRLRPGQRWVYSTRKNEVIYIHHGEAWLLPGKKMNTGAMLILPPGCHQAVRAATAVSLYLVRVREGFRLPLPQGERRGAALQFADMQPVVIPPEFRLLFTLLLDEHLEGMLTPQIVEAKMSELYTLLKAYHSQETVNNLFLPFLDEKAAFISKIWSNHARVRTVSELAALCHCSRSTFQRKFKEAFGVSPYRWILEQKVALIEYELFSTNKQVKQIAEEQGFSSVSQFSDFCKTNLDHSPQKLRKMHFGIWTEE